MDSFSQENFTKTQRDREGREKERTRISYIFYLHFFIHFWNWKFKIYNIKTLENLEKNKKS